LITLAVVVIFFDGRPGPRRGDLAQKSAAAGKPSVER
jgi:hypothetical protein